MQHKEWVIPFICVCVIWCPFSWTWWAYWQAKLLEYVRKNHPEFDRTVLWQRKRSFLLNMSSIYLFGLNNNTLQDERVAYLKSKLRPALIGFLGGQFLATVYTIGLIVAKQVFNLL